MIVDGRCRWRACEIAGVDPKIERREFADDRDVLDFIISMNVQRSHKTEDQCAMAAARLSEWEEDCSPPACPGPSAAKCDEGAIGAALR